MTAGQMLPGLSHTATVNLNTNGATNTGFELRFVLTRVGFQEAVGAPEVLRVLYHGDLGHADDHGIWAHFGGGRGVAAVGDVVDGGARVVIIADH